MSENEQLAQLIPLESVRPDPEQPRRLLSADLGQALASGSSPLDILAQLRARAEHDKWTRERLKELDALAQSISDDGLIQPIRVIRDGDDCYRIEEGERRWWAHHILVGQGREEFNRIRAFVVEKELSSVGVLRRRVAENVLRSDFTAIELARAMANRIQEIVSAEPSIKQGDAERRVGSENGMSDRRVRQFVALLTLSPEAQELAQQARLTENSLRQIVGKDTVGQLAAIRGLMHPDRQKARPHHKAQSTKRPRRRQTGNHAVQNRKRRARANREPAQQREHPDRALNRRSITRANTEQRALRKLFVLARSFKRMNLEHLDRGEWNRLMKVESDCAAIVNFHRILKRSLAMRHE